MKMIARYECDINQSEYEGLTAESVEKAKAALKKEGYEWYHEGEQLIINGEREVCEDFSAEEVAREIQWILRHEAEMDADVTAEIVEYEPDWDKMPGGYDYYRG